MSYTEDAIYKVIPDSEVMSRLNHQLFQITGTTGYFKGGELVQFLIEPSSLEEQCHFLGPYDGTFKTNLIQPSKLTGNFSDSLEYYYHPATDYEMNEKINYRNSEYFYNSYQQSSVILLHSTNFQIYADSPLRILPPKRFLDSVVKDLSLYESFTNWYDYFDSISPGDSIVNCELTDIGTCLSSIDDEIMILNIDNQTTSILSADELRRICLLGSNDALPTFFKKSGAGNHFLLDYKKNLGLRNAN